MNKRFLVTLLAGVIGLSLTAGAVEPSPAVEKQLFDSTARHLDFGGNYCHYLNLSGIPEQFNVLLTSALIGSGGMDSATAGDIVKVIGSLLNFEAVQAIGLSSITAADASNVYVNKYFIHLAEAQPRGVLFDLAGRENRQLTGMKMIPANARLAFGLHLDPVSAWKSLSAAFAASQQEGNRNFPAELASKAEQALGCKFDDFLAGLTGEAFFLLTSDSASLALQPQLLLILPDRKGLLAQLFQDPAKGMGMNLQKESETVYTVQLPGLPPQIRSQLILENGRIVITSSPELYNLARTAANGGAATNPELASYFRDMPGDGLGFFYLNLPSEMMQNALQLGTSMSQELGTFQPMLAKIPDLTVYGVSRKEAEGYAGVVRSSLSFAQLQGATPMLVVGSMLLPALNQARERARRISCVSNNKQIMLSLFQYAIDHDDRFPADNGVAGLNLLLQEGILTDRAVYCCPSTADAPGEGNLTEDSCSYIYLGGIVLDDKLDASNHPVVFDKPGNHHDYVTVGFADGHVEGLELPGYDSPEQVIDYLMQNRGLSEKTGEALKQQLQNWSNTRAK